MVSEFKVEPCTHKMEVNTHCTHWYLEQRASTDSVDMVCKDGLENWGTPPKCQQLYVQMSKMRSKHQFQREKRGIKQCREIF